jgi:hypothetical protein
MFREIHPEMRLKKQQIFEIKTNFTPIVVKA